MKQDDPEVGRMKSLDEFMQALLDPGVPVCGRAMKLPKRLLRSNWQFL